LDGHVEANEYSQLRSAALREVEEEAGLVAAEISNSTLRRALLVSRPWQPVRVLFYFTGLLSHIVTPNCPEGTTFWKRELEFDALDIIETTRPVLSLLIQDMKTDPEGTALPVMGMAVFDARGTFQRVLWAT
jgi:8-oxo-dGTP pyrophosphatase MutT (NUDIX family)